jgi:hypothetical protein
LVARFRQRWQPTGYQAKSVDEPFCHARLRSRGRSRLLSESMFTCISGGDGSAEKSGNFKLGHRVVQRLGYGAMQLAGPGVFGPSKDHPAAVAVLRAAIASRVNHIDTSDFYGPHVTNRLIRVAPAPYPDDLLIVTKIGARCGADGSWLPAFSPEGLTQSVHDNLRNLGLDVLDLVNLRIMFGIHGPAEGSIEAPMTVLAELQRQGLVRHIGLSNVTAAQFEEGRLAYAGRTCLVAAPRAQYPADPWNLVGRTSAGESCGGRPSLSGRCGGGARQHSGNDPCRLNEELETGTQSHRASVHNEDSTGVRPLGLSMSTQRSRQAPVDGC